MFKALGNLGNMAGMMKQMQEMGGKMEALSERLKNERVRGVAGGEMVIVEANGLGQVLKVTIDAAIQSEGDWEMAQDLLPAAINDAIAKAKQMHADAMQELTGGMDLPGLGEALNKFGIGN